MEIFYTEPATFVQILIPEVTVSQSISYKVLYTYIQQLYF
ncbi:hypothetical protein SAMN04488574_11336 [Bacillus sp. 71mf]|nr:hypothetical protein SAMN04488574_11336 [Bacillus sp. 71mf]SFT03895.1 hypothetical protein SAMN04488145_10843 [Bacillus sp. 103mf]